jgi:hypothetical protein
MRNALFEAIPVMNPDTPTYIGVRFAVSGFDFGIEGARGADRSRCVEDE